MITNLFVEINRTIYYQKNAEDIQSSTNLLTNILHYIHNNIHEELSLDLLANKLLTNKSTITHTFKKDMGTSLYHYIIQRPLIIAKNNIISGMPINKIHESCGFSDYSCFYRAFKKEYGLNPTEFKIMHKERVSK